MPAPRSLHRNTGAISLYSLGYAVTATVTTQLDETGLATPKIAVTNGIAMNGSQVTGLGAGVNPTDAINKGQLDAAIAGVSGGGSGGTPYVAVSSTAAPPAATGSNAAAIGGGAAANGDGTAALAANATASGLNTTALGAGAFADGVQSTATGSGSEANGIGALAFGAYSAARGTFSTALGYAAYAPIDDATAIGHGAQAYQTSATAIGAGAKASAASATAIGTGAAAGYANSTAVGANAQTTAANQVMLGGSGSAVVVADINASTAAQVGPVSAVTIDANGTLGRQAVATTQDVRTAVEYISAVTDSQFASLTNQVSMIEGRVNTLFDLADTIDRNAQRGIAAVAAMSAPHFPSEAGRTSYASNVAVYRGQVGFSAGMMHRFEGDVALTAGATYAGGNSTTVKVGVAGEF